MPVALALRARPGDRAGRGTRANTWRVLSRGEVAPFCEPAAIVFEGLVVAIVSADLQQHDRHFPLFMVVLDHAHQTVLTLYRELVRHPDNRNLVNDPSSAVEVGIGGRKREHQLALEMIEVRQQGVVLFTGGTASSVVRPTRPDAILLLTGIERLGLDVGRLL